MYTDQEVFLYAVRALERRGHTFDDACIIGRQLADMPAPVAHMADGDRFDGLCIAYREALKAARGHSIVQQVTAEIAIELNAETDAAIAEVERLIRARRAS